MCVRERERERETEAEGVRVCVRVYVCERERERERARAHTPTHTHPRTHTWYSPVWVVKKPGSTVVGEALPVGQYTDELPHRTCIGDVDAVGQ